MWPLYTSWHESVVSRTGHFVHPCYLHAHRFSFIFYRFFKTVCIKLLRLGVWQNSTWKTWTNAPIAHADYVHVSPVQMAKTPGPVHPERGYLESVLPQTYQLVQLIRVWDPLVISIVWWHQSNGSPVILRFLMRSLYRASTCPCFCGHFTFPLISFSLSQIHLERISLLSVFVRMFVW